MRAKIFTLLVGIVCMLALPTASFAQCAAGEQEVVINVTPSGFPAEISWELVSDADTSIVASAACGSYGPPSSDTLCLPQGDYTFNALDDWGDSWNGGTYEIYVDGGLAAAGSPDNGLPGDGAGGCGSSDLEESVAVSLNGCTGGQVPGQLIIALSGFPAEVSWELLDGSGDTVASAACGSAMSETIDLCLNDGETYTFNALDDWGDGWNGGTFDLLEDGVSVLSGAPNNGLPGDGAGGCGGSDLEFTGTFTVGGPVAGCTDSTALNYNPAATVDDGSCAFPSPNDECADAIDIMTGSCVSGDLVNATYNPADSVDGTCPGLSTGTALDIWFTTMVPPSGNLTVETPIVPGITSTIEFLTGSCGSLVPLAGVPCTNYGPGGGVTITGLTPGETIYLRYFDFGNNDEGAYEICVSEPTSGCTDPCAANFDSTASIDDGSCTFLSTAFDCASAGTAVAGTTPFYNGDAVADTVDITSCVSSDLLATWYAYTIPAGLVNVDIYTCGSTFDTGLSLWDACGGNEIACNDDGTPGAVGSTCDGSNFQSYIQLDAAALDTMEGMTVYIRIAGFSGQSGCGDLIIDEAMPCGTPVNLMHTIAPDGMSVTVSWDPVPGADGYRIRGSRAGGAFRYRNTTATSLTVPIQLDKGPYVWQVKAGCTYDNSGFSDLDVISTMPRVGNFELGMLPNPADEQVQLTVTAEEGAEVFYQIVDMLGRVVADGQVIGTGAAQTVIVKTADFPQGTYLVNIKGAEGVNTQSLQIAH